MVEVAHRLTKKIVTVVLQFNFGFCKYCAGTNPTWRMIMAAKAKKATKKKATKKKAAKKK